MPNGLCEKGTQEAAAVYYEHILLYPYQMYIHWSPSDQGNILFNDKRFVSLLYRWHNDEFTEYNKVSDAGSYIKDSIYDFIDDSRKVVIVVDCENSDPYKLSATLRRLNSTYTEKITSIILFDDIHTASAWSSLEKFTSVSVEHILIERIKPVSYTHLDVYKRQPMFFKNWASPIKYSERLPNHLHSIHV